MLIILDLEKSNIRPFGLSRFYNYHYHDYDDYGKIRSSVSKIHNDFVTKYGHIPSTRVILSLNELEGILREMNYYGFFRTDIANYLNATSVSVLIDEMYP